MELTEIQRAILRKMISKKAIGSHPIRLTTLLRCAWKSHERGLVKDEVNNLINMGLLNWSRKSKETIVLRKEKLAEINALAY